MKNSKTFLHIFEGEGGTWKDGHTKDSSAQRGMLIEAEHIEGKSAKRRVRKARAHI